MSVPCLPDNIEKQLLDRVARGEEAAFALLFNAYHQRLGAYVHRFTESLPATQEIVQDVFVKIWIRRDTLAEIKSFDAYLFMAARNHVLNYLRRQARERARKKELIAILPGRQQKDDPSRDEQEYLTLLDQAINQLPPQQKNVYILHRHQGLSHVEIAGRLHLSVETVKKHMSLALRSIRDYLSLARLPG